MFVGWFVCNLLAACSPEPKVPRKKVDFLDRADLNPYHFHICNCAISLVLSSCPSRRRNCLDDSGLIYLSSLSSGFGWSLPDVRADPQHTSVELSVVVRAWSACNIAVCSSLVPLSALPFAEPSATIRGAELLMIMVCV